MSDVMKRRERLQNLCDSLAHSRMHDAANDYRDSVATCPVGVQRDQSHAYQDFISGWEACMRVRSEELLEENRELHNVVMDVCAHLMIKRCEACRGRCCDNELNDCPECDGTGFVEIPDEAERIVKEIKQGKDAPQ